jgi:biotin carboxyl carrier protein
VIAIPDCIVCVAPSDGRARPLVEPGRRVQRGELVAIVDAPGRPARVHAPATGRVGGALASPEQRIAKGEGVVWLSR